MGRAGGPKFRGTTSTPLSNAALKPIDGCYTFVTTDSGAQETQGGKHDDRVLAAGIARQVRKRAVSKGTSQRPAGW